MKEILHQLIGSLAQYLHCFLHPRWCRISSINSITIILDPKMIFFEANLAPISGLKGGKTEEVNPQLPVTVLYAAIFFTMLSTPFPSTSPATVDRRKSS